MRKHKRRIVIATILAFGLGAPALATPTAVEHASTSIPEPSDFALFLMGVAGLVIGRRSSRRRDDDTKA